MTDEIKIVGVDVQNVGVPRNDGTAGSALYNVPIRLSQSPDYQWAQLFVKNWNSPPSFTTMHRPGIARVVGACIHLNGTTIEEVEKYHKKTLELAVDLANQEYRREREASAQRQEAQKASEESHRQNVRDIAERMNWDR